MTRDSATESTEEIVKIIQIRSMFVMFRQENKRGLQLYLFISTLLVCLFVPINVRTAEHIGPKFREGS